MVLCLELGHLLEGEVAFSRSTALLMLHVSCWGKEARRVWCSGVLCSVLDWSLRAAQALRAGLLLGCVRAPCAFGPWPWQGVPVAGVSLR